MDQSEGVDILESLKNLPRDCLHPSQGEVRLWLFLPVELVVFVEIVLEELGDYKEVLFVVEVIENSQDIMLVDISIYIDEGEQLDFIDALVKIILVVFYDFHAVVMAGPQVLTLDCLAEGSGSQVLFDDVPTCDDRPYYDRELFGLLKACSLTVVNHFQVEAVVNGVVMPHRVK